MANLLTGDFEAVVQISMRQINGLLASLHQNGADENATLKLPHSSGFLIGHDRPDFADQVRADLSEWVRSFQTASPSGGVQDFREHLTEFAPPGVAKLMQDALAEVGGVLAPPDATPATVRGTARVQFASPTVSLPDGSTAEVTIHAGIRAHYQPDPGTEGLPEPIHGEVEATYEVRVVMNPRDHRRPIRRQLHIQPSSQDSKIRFVAAQGTGLSAAAVEQISLQVRKALREGLTMLPVDLLPGFPFSQFKAVGSGLPSPFPNPFPGQHALALPLQLSGAASPAGGVQSLSHAFVGSSGFGFAVSNDYVTTMLHVSAIKAAIAARHITLTVDLGFTSVSATYSFRFSVGPALNWRVGAIDIHGRIELETGTTLAPNGFVEFTQTVTLELNPSTQIISLKAVGDPSVDESWFIPHNTVLNIVKSETNHALTSSAGPVNTAFADARTKLVSGLRAFDPSLSAHYTGVAITPDGIIVRGEMSGSGPRRAAVIDIAETNGRQAFTAHKSWIPGGRIDRLIWSWVEHTGHVPTVWSGVVKTFVDEHQFIFAKPPGITELGSVCLRIEGTQTLADGQVVGAAGGTTCHLPDFGELLDSPSWWSPITLPIWTPGAGPDSVLREHVAGHISVQASAPHSGDPGHNTLVCFPDWKSAKPLEMLGRAVSAMRRKRFSLVVVVVLPPGAFDSRRREVEARLASVGERFPAMLLPTEDHEGGWSKAFDVAKTPSVYLVNARRQFVWKHEGEADSKLLAAALDEHLTPAAAPRSRPLRLDVSAGAPAPDAIFQDHQGDGFALHRMRGEEVLLNFWQAWSAPCIKELVRLQALQSPDDRPVPRVIAFHGGPDGKVLDKIAKQHGLTFSLVQDTDQRIARQFGVRCWPTTLSLGHDGIVNHVQFGMASEHARPHPKGSEVSQEARPKE
jgi:peroxiredoxin